MKGQIDSILEDLYNDISLNKEDQEELEDSCKNFISGELEKIKITLSNRVNEFCTKEVKKLKDKKMDRFNKNMNVLTENTCRFIADEFGLDEDEVMEQNKDNLLKINDYHEVYKQNYIENNDKNDEDDENDDENDDNTKNHFEVKKEIVLDSSNENDEYKGFLISKKQCPAFIKGKYCCKAPKPGTLYCGYHKRFNEQ
tara:strand:+ start:304 stop:897 length:594 start_codon:yes stop_codon:yes gene_type:complete